MIGLYTTDDKYVTGKFTLEYGEAVIVDDWYAAPRLETGVLERLPDDVTAHLLESGIEPYVPFSFVSTASGEEDEEEDEVPCPDPDCATWDGDECDDESCPKHGEGSQENTEKDEGNKGEGEKDEDEKDEDEKDDEEKPARRKYNRKSN